MLSTVSTLVKAESLNYQINAMKSRPFKVQSYIKSYKYKRK